MQTNKNSHTNKKLQELENQSLPDLSRMDNHWEQMKTMLEPGTVPVGIKKGFTQKYFHWMMAPLIIGGLFIVTYKSFNRTKKEKNIINQTAQPVLNINKIEKDSSSVTIKKSTDIPQIKLQKPKLPTPIKLLEPKTTDKKDSILRDTPVADQINLATDDAATSLNKFFKQLEKQPQEFVIDNEKDTVIIGSDRTELFIPANCFPGKKNVIIELQEFYSYADIVANRLSTTSNSQQLISGGMLNIKVFSDDQEIVKSQKNILIKMPLKKFDDSMQLFLPEKNVARKTNTIDGNDTSNITSQGTFINWQAAGQKQIFYGGFINVLNLMDDHYEVDYDKYTTAHYYIAKKCPLSNQEIKAELEKRYGRLYGRIKVKRLWWGDKKKFLFSKDEHPVVGDSISMSFESALQNKLVPKEDSIKYISNLKKDSLNFISIGKLENKYNFSIRNLGWINCDRFYNDSRPKIDYYVSLNDTASNYETMLIFDKLKSLMRGYISGNNVVFANVPEGESAKIICVGIQNGKPVSSLQTVQLSRTTLTGLKFEETNPTEFKKQTAILDK